MVVLPTPGGPPEDEAGERVAGEHGGERAGGTDEVGLAHDLLQAGGAQAVRERAGAGWSRRRGRGFGEEGGLMRLGHGGVCVSVWPHVAANVQRRMQSLVLGMRLIQL